jgi:CubicO group peptidase (beta-lactamase class C family)
MSSLANELDAIAAETTFSGVVRVDSTDGTEVVKAYGLAHRGYEIPNEVDTQFAIASGTKGLTALVVVSLISEGRLDLSTTARSVLGQDLPLISDDVTVEHLLSHRSGIGDYLDEEVEVDLSEYLMPVPVHELATTEQYLAVLDGHPQKFNPGERFAYCNGGYVVLALIAERTSGVPFHDLVRLLVCEPAGMGDTEFLRSDELPGRAALGYLTIDGAWRTNVFHLPVRQRRRRDLFHRRRHHLSLESVLRRRDRVDALGQGDGARPQRGAVGVEALRPRFLAARVDRQRDFGGQRRRRVVPHRPRPALRRHAHGDLEHIRRSLADRSVPRRTVRHLTAVEHQLLGSG